MAEQYSVEAILSLVDKGFSSGIANAQRNLGKLNESTSSMMKGMAVATTAAVGAIKVGLAAVGLSSIETAGEVRAAQAQFDQVFASIEGTAKKHLNQVASNVGALPNRILPAFNQISAFAKVAGMDTAQALGFTERATTAAADSAAFFDRSLEETTENLKSYLKGNFAVADNLGILSTETTRNAKAMELFGQKYKDLEGVQQQEVLLQMFEDANKVSGAMGQAARETDGFENVMGNLKQSATDLRGAIGLPLLDPFVKSAKVATKVIRAITDKLPAFKEALGQTEFGQGLITSFENIISKGEGLVDLINNMKFDPASIDAFVKSFGAIAGLMPILFGIAPAFPWISKGAIEVSTAISSLSNKSIPSFGKMKEAVTGYKKSFLTAFDSFKGKASEFGALVPKKVEGAFGSMGAKVGAFGGKVKSGFETMAIKGMYASDALSARFPAVSNAVGVVTAKVKTMIPALQTSANIGTSLFTRTSNAIGQVAMMALQVVGPMALLGAGLAVAGLAMGAFGDQITQALNTAISQGPQIISNFANGIISQIPSLVSTGVQLVAQLGNVIAVNLPVITQKGIEIVSALVSSVGSNVGQLLQTGLQIITTLVNSIVSGIPQLIMIGMDFLVKLTEGIIQNIPMIVESAQSIVDNFAKNLETYLPQIIQTGIQILMNLIQGIVQMIPKLIPVVVSLVQSFIQAILSNLPTILNGGIQLVMALVQGIISNLPAIMQGALQIIQSLVKGIAEALPQITTAGLQLILQLITALITGLPQILQAGWDLIVGLGQAMLEAIPGAIGGVVEGVTSFFGGLWDTLTGKSTETTTKVKTDFTNMSTQIQTDSSTMATKASSNVNLMAGQVGSAFNLMNTNALTATSGINTAVSNDFLSAQTNASGAVVGIQNAADQALNATQNVATTSATNAQTALTNNYQTAQANVAGATAQIDASTASALNNAAASAQNAGGQISNAITSSMNTVTSTVNSAMSGISSTITSNMAGVSNTIRSQLQSVSATAKASFTGIVSTVNSSMASFQSTITSRMNASRTAISSAVSGMRSSISNGMSSAVSSVRSAMNSVLASMNSTASGAHSAGYYTGMGFYNGLAATSGSIMALASSIAYSVSARIQSALDIHSPSRVTRALGGYTGEGLYLGVMDWVGKVAGASDNLAEAAIPAIDGASFGRGLSLSHVMEMQVQHSDIQFNARQALKLTLHLGKQAFTGFVSDIRDTMQAEINLEQAY